MHIRIIKSYMERHRLSQAKMGKIFEISRSEMSLILRGKRMPGRKLSKKIIYRTGYCPMCGLDVQ